MDFGDEHGGGLGAEVAVDGGLELVEVLDGAFDGFYGEGKGVRGLVGWKRAG